MTEPTVTTRLDPASSDEHEKWGFSWKFTVRYVYPDEGISEWVEVFKDKPTAAQLVRVRVYADRLVAEQVIKTRQSMQEKQQ
jgi:hypothetical protein